MVLSFEKDSSFFLTNATIKYHRKNLFEKLDVRHISEALSLVANSKMICNIEYQVALTSNYFCATAFLYVLLHVF
ncbi:MAG: LuxR C-terminal-related transcriptional regulator [Tannerella sp.]|nr:LuxR C-terminal-related transcriptional regulator [Tannerella sp.]